MREERIEENQGNTKNTKEQNRMANPIFWSIIWFYYFCLTWILFGTFLQYQFTLFLSWSSVSQGWLKQLSFDSWSSKV
jgi:cell division septal protein FtsQ